MAEYEVSYEMIGIQPVYKEITSRLTGILEQGEPEILYNSSNKNYKCFCMQDLFDDLFFGRKDRNPLLKNIFLSKDKKEMFSFILPNDILNRVLANGNIKISKSINDYQGFFLLTLDNNKLIIRLHKTLANVGFNDFVRPVQEHIIEKLSSEELSLNSELIAYLKNVGNATIVPFKISPKANTEFNALLETKTNSSISKIIANFLISALIGLRALKYNGDGKTIYKTYLLNALGMEYIWCPDSITTTYEKLQRIQQLYSLGEYGTTYSQVKAWLNDYESFVSKTEVAIAYELIGCCLFLHPTECTTNGKSVSGLQNEGITFLQSCVETGNASSNVYYLLYAYFSNSVGEHQNVSKAIEYLKTAFALKNANAVIEVANLILTPEGSDNQIVTTEVILAQLNYIIEHDSQYTKTEVSECLYLRGLIRKSNGNYGGAEADFEDAARRGHEKANQTMNRKARLNHFSSPIFLERTAHNMCFANSLSGYNLSVLKSFPSNEWSVFSTEAEEQTNMGVLTVSNIDDFIELLSSKTHERKCTRCTVLFMGKEENENLKDCLSFLDKLFNIVLNEDEYYKWLLIDCLDIYVAANYDTAAMLIDASIDNMGKDIYFKVHIKDVAKESAHQLLCDVPLFIPFMRKPKGESFSNVVLIGSSETNYKVIKESIACAYMGEVHPVAITMVGDNAKHYELRLHQECPGLFQAGHVSCIVPEFIPLNVSEADFPKYIYEFDAESTSENPICAIFKLGNYFIVDLENDLDSIKFAMELRTWLLRSRGTFDRTPFIAVRVADARNSYLSNHLTLSGKTPGDAFHSKYDLFTFGTAEYIFSYSRMIESNQLERTALCIHKSYYGDDERAAENDYYSYSYNADSSICTAIGLSYRLFVGGEYFPDAHMYYNFGGLTNSKLYSNYANKVEDILERAASLEQSRWNGHLLSRGWLPASEAQVEAYRTQATGSSHKHQLAKLHPFIREWDDLKDENIRRILGILKSKFNYTKSPQAITRQSIKDTSMFISRTAKSAMQNKD